MAPFALTIDVEELEEDGVVLLRMVGRIDTHTCDHLQQTMADIFNSGFYRLILDLEKIDYFSSAGIGVLINCSARANEHDGNVILMNPSHQVSTLLMLIGVSESLATAPNYASALALF